MPKELEKLRDWEKEFDENDEFIASDGRFLTGTETPKYVKNFIRKLFQERDKLLVERIEGIIEPLQEKHDRLQKQYQRVYDLWFKYGYRDKKTEQEIKSFETGTNGNVMASCFDKIESLKQVISFINNIEPK